jgi:hypothetical protein
MPVDHLDVLSESPVPVPGHSLSAQIAQPSNKMPRLRMTPENLIQA